MTSFRPEPKFSQKRSPGMFWSFAGSNATIARSRLTRSRRILSEACNDQRVKLNPFRVEDQADLLQDIKLLSKEENL